MNWWAYGFSWERGCGVNAAACQGNFSASHGQVASTRRKTRLTAPPKPNTTTALHFTQLRRAQTENFSPSLGSVLKDNDIGFKSHLLRSSCKDPLPSSTRRVQPSSQHNLVHSQKNSNCFPEPFPNSQLPIMNSDASKVQ